MYVKLQRVEVTTIGFVFPQEVVAQFNFKAGDICAQVVMEHGLKLRAYDLEFEQMNAENEQAGIEYLNVIMKVGVNTIGAALPQEFLNQFNLKAGNMLPLVIMEDGIQLRADRKPKSQPGKVADQSRDASRSSGWWMDQSGRPMGWWLDDYAD